MRSTSLAHTISLNGADERKYLIYREVNLNNKKQITPEELHRLYVDERKSSTEISILFGCSPATIINRLREYEIAIRSYSEATRGRPNTWAHKAADKNRGKRRPGVGGQKKGCISWSKGLTKSTDTRLANTGKQRERHWSWKGGISEQNALIRQSGEYKQWRRFVFDRDNFTCQECGVRGGDIEAHHISHFAGDKDRRFDINNGTTLCVKCHTGLHRKERICQSMDPEQ